MAISSMPPALVSYAEAPPTIEAFGNTAVARAVTVRVALANLSWSGDRTRLRKAGREGPTERAVCLSLVRARPRAVEASRRSKAWILPESVRPTGPAQILTT
jgi:hypothetical protein